MASRAPGGRCPRLLLRALCCSASRRGGPRRGSRGRRLAAAALIAAVGLTVVGAEARAQVAAVPASGLATTAVRGPLALGPGDALYVGGWWRFDKRTGGSALFDGSGTLSPTWPAIDAAVNA